MVYLKLFWLRSAAMVVLESLPLKCCEPFGADPCGLGLGGDLGFPRLELATVIAARGCKRGQGQQRQDQGGKAKDGKQDIYSGQGLAFTLLSGKALASPAIQRDVFARFFPPYRGEVSHSAKYFSPETVARWPPLLEG